MKLITEMTRKEFEDLPGRKWDEDIGQFTALVILPLRRKHESGLRLMDFVAAREARPLCRLSGCSDVLHIGGIGGYGGGLSNPPRRIPWQIDCLPKSGLLCLSSFEYLYCGDALSSFSIYSTDKPMTDMDWTAMVVANAVRT